MFDEYVFIVLKMPQWKDTIEEISIEWVSIIRIFS